MSPEQLRQVQVLFEQLDAMPPEQWRAKLTEVSDPVVGRKLEQMLMSRPTADRGVDDQLRDAAKVADNATADDLPQGSKIDCFTIQEFLGDGGFGRVYRAQERREGIDRPVALKIIKPGMDTKEVLARFDAERRLMGFMNHQHVARVYSAGSYSSRPYFVMELVPGKSITDYADHNQLSMEERLRLFQQVCSALQHAHDLGIIHRDIKPNNVLAYTAPDGRPMAKVIDFGIAKSLTGDRMTDRSFMHTGHRPLGTWGHMSPEQVEGAPDINHLTDIYSLGVLLYELLIGRAPFDEVMLRRAADEEAKRVICHVEPPRPSTRLSSLSAGESTPIATARQARLATLRRQLRSDLEWIPLMAMSKRRRARYGSASAMSADIDNYLNHRGIQATQLARRKRRRVVMVSCIIAIEIAVPCLGWAAVHNGWLSLKSWTSQPSNAPASQQLVDAENLLMQADHADPDQRRTLSTSAAQYLWPMVDDFGQSDLRVWHAAARAAAGAEDPALAVRSLEALGRLDPRGSESNAVAEALRKSTPNTALNAWIVGRSQVVRLYTSANSGDAAAAFQLGEVYESGHYGLAEDRSRAITWYQLAARAGNANAKAKLQDWNQSW